MSLLRRIEEASRQGLSPQPIQHKEYKTDLEWFQDAIASLPQRLARAIAPSGGEHRERIEAALSRVVGRSRIGERHLEVVDKEDAESDPLRILESRHVSVVPLRAEGNSSVVTVTAEGSRILGARPKPGMNTRCGTVWRGYMTLTKVQVESRFPGAIQFLVFQDGYIGWRLTIGERQISGGLAHREAPQLEAEDLEAIAFTLEQTADDIFGETGCILRLVLFIGRWRS
jgi:hypothetical protein